MNLGTRKVYWWEIRARIKEVNLEFFNLIDRLHPDSDLPLYLLTFPYGNLIGNESSQFIPMSDGTLIKLTDSSLPSELISHLGYGKNNSPLGMILDKQFEWYVDLPNKNITLPTLIQKPGEFFSYGKLLDINSKFNYSPMGVLKAVSGARTIFMIPSIGCQTKFTKLRRELGIKAKQPNHMYDHFELFKTILNSDEITPSWSSSIIYFSENWVNNIKNNPEWSDVQKYFYSIFARNAMYLKNLPYYQTAYSLLLETTNQKPNPYLFDTFKHIIDMMTGETPGFAPQITNETLPLDILQKVFIDHYGLKSTVPTIMAPTYFNIQQDDSVPIYYSMQYPTTTTFSPNSKKTSTMAAMRELKNMCKDLLEELIKDNHLCSNTIIQHIAKNIAVSFFHNTEDIDGLIDNIPRLIATDSRFNHTIDGALDLAPAEDSKFFRGCLQITKKH